MQALPLTSWVTCAPLLPHHNSGTTAEVAPSESHMRTWSSQQTSTHSIAPGPETSMQALRAHYYRTMKEAFFCFPFSKVHFYFTSSGAHRAWQCCTFSNFSSISIFCPVQNIVLKCTHLKKWMQSSGKFQYVKPWCFMERPQCARPRAKDFQY